MDRECEKCVYHDENGCKLWSCEGTTTLERYKTEVVIETIKPIQKVITDFCCDRITEPMKALQKISETITELLKGV